MTNSNDATRIAAKPVKPPFQELVEDLGMRTVSSTGVCMNLLFGDRSGGFGILMYHRITDNIPGIPKPSINVPPRRFARQMTGLLKRGFSIWPLTRILDSYRAGRLIPPRVTAVTFDDGYEGVYAHAYPVLKRLGIPATVFLPTAYLGSEEPFPFDHWALKHRDRVPPEAYRCMNLRQCLEMGSDDLIEFGVHTHRHADLRGQPLAFRDDLQQSIDIVRAIFASESMTFAFPFGTPRLGYASDELVAAARQTGVVCSLTTESIVNGPDQDPYRWGRFNVFPWDTGATLAAKLQGWYSWAPRWRQRFVRGIGRDDLVPGVSTDATLAAPPATASSPASPPPPATFETGDSDLPRPEIAAPEVAAPEATEPESAAPEAAMPVSAVPNVAAAVVTVHQVGVFGLAAGIPRGDVETEVRTAAACIAEGWDSATGSAGGEDVGGRARDDGRAPEAASGVENSPVGTAIVEVVQERERRFLRQPDGSNPPATSGRSEDPPMISVVLPTFNRAYWLGDALRSLVDQETDGTFRFEVVVVDNGSRDETRQVVENFSARGPVSVSYLYQRRPGDAPTRNAGVRLAVGQWIAFFDDDQLAPRHWLAHLLRAARERHVKIVGGPVHVALPDDQLSDLGTHCRRALRETRLYDRSRCYAAGDHPGAGNALVAREVFDHVGLFDESMNTGGSDIDFFARARAHGYRQWYEHKAFIRHRVSPERLSPAFFRWDAMSGGADHARYLDYRKGGRGLLTACCLARLTHAALLVTPRLACAKLLGNRGVALDQKVRLWRCEGYVRRALSILLPRLFRQDALFRSFDFHDYRAAGILTDDDAPLDDTRAAAESVATGDESSREPDGERVGTMVEA